MASIGGLYNPDAEPNSSGIIYPIGVYQMELVESEYAATSKGTGMVLKCKAQIIGGDFDGRPFYLNYNLENQNDTAQEIGQRDFAGLRLATGVPAPDESEELHFKPFWVKVGIGKRKDNGEDQNTIREYFAEEPAAQPGARPAPTPRPANNNTPAAAATSAAPKSKPWAKK